MVVYEIFGPINKDDSANTAHLPTAFTVGAPTTRMWRVKPGAAINMIWTMVGTHAGLQVRCDFAPGINLDSYVPGAAPASALDFNQTYLPTISGATDWGSIRIPSVAGTSGSVNSPPNTFSLASGEGANGRVFMDGLSLITGNAGDCLYVVPRGAAWMRTMVKKSSSAPTSLRIVAVVEGDYRSY